MTLFDTLNEMNAQVKNKGRQAPREELQLLYPIVSEMFAEITKALNFGYAWPSIGGAVIARLEAEGKGTKCLRTVDVADIYRHIKKDRDLRGIL